MCNLSFFKAKFEICYTPLSVQTWLAKKLDSCFELFQLAKNQIRDFELKDLKITNLIFCKLKKLKNKKCSLKINPYHVSEHDFK